MDTNTDCVIREMGVRVRLERRGIIFEARKHGQNNWERGGGATERQLYDLLAAVELLRAVNIFDMLHIPLRLLLAPDVPKEVISCPLAGRNPRVHHHCIKLDR